MRADQDASLTIRDSQGVELLLLDSFSRGSEPICFAALQSGRYLLEAEMVGQEGASSSYALDLRVVPADRSAVQCAIAVRLATWAKQLSLRTQSPASRAERIRADSQALEIWRELGQPAWELATLVRLATAHYRADRFEQAAGFFRQALPLSQNLGNEKAHAEILNGLGMTCWHMGRPHEAIQHLEGAIPLFEQTRYREGEAASYSNLGVLHWYLGEWQQALDLYLKALKKVRDTGNQLGEAITLSNIGVAYHSLGQPEKGAFHLQESIRLLDRLGISFRAARSRSILSRILLDLGQVAQARELQQEALRTLRKRGGRAYAEALNYLGRIGLRAKSDPQAVERSLFSALNEFRRIEDRRGEAASLHLMGLLKSWQGHLSEALGLYGQALEIRRELGGTDAQVSTLFQLAKTRLALEQPESALDNIREAVDLSESLRIRAASLEDRATYYATKYDLFELYVHLLMKRGQENGSDEWRAAAFDASERARARSFLDLLGEGQIAVARKDDEVQLQRQINFAAYRLSQVGGVEARSELRRQLERLLQELGSIRAQSRARGLKSLDLASPLSLNEIQQSVLEEGSLLLEFELGEPSSYLWAVTRNRFYSYRLPARRQIFEQARRLLHLSDKAVSEEEWMEAAAPLANTLLKPVVHRLKGRRLYIVADEILQYIPFAALPDPLNRRFLVEEHELVSLPSASTLGVLKQRFDGRQPPSKHVAILADPVFDSADPRLPASTKARHLAVSTARMSSAGSLAEFSRLPFAQREANAILALAPAGTAFSATGFEASKPTALDPALAQYRILHFATHGVIDDRRPQLSSLVLSLVDAEGRPVDGFLRLHEIASLRLPVDLVVLSACRSGLGQEIRGEGLIGLTRAFMQAGAGSVVVSLWNIDDEATSQLMRHFYAHLFSKASPPPAQALRSAQLEIRNQKRWRSPYYWSGFIFQGGWRQ